ncbi:MAG: hypothetical protein ACOZCL_08935 [Bacillota bacterium]
MRIIGRFPDQRQVSGFIDSIKNAGFDRKDMIISNLADAESFHSVKEAAENTIFIKSERDELGSTEGFAAGIEGLKGKTGIVVAVHTPKHESDRVRAIMEQQGAVEIIQD